MEQFIELLKELLNNKNISAQQKENIKNMLNDYKNTQEKLASDINEILNNL